MMSPPAAENLAMAGKVALVTGSTQGLGEAVARLFAERGAAGLVVTGRNAANGARVVADLRKMGARAIYVEADLARLADARLLVAACEKEFGRLDALVNCAAITDRGSIWDTSPELYDRILAINLKAPFFLMQDALHLMRKMATKGTIVNILSMSGHGGQSFLSAYSMSKGALATLTKNVAYTVMGHHIRVNGLAIGWMDTPGEDRIMKTYHGADDGWLAKVEATRPFGRLLKPAEVARAVAYLSSAESGLMTGAIIDFDQQVLGAGDSPAQVP